MIRHKTLVGWGMMGAVLALVAGSPGWAVQTAVPGPSFEDVIGLRTLGGVAMAPDGRGVAYTVRSTDWKENRYDVEIWLAVEGRPAFQLTRTERGSSTTPRWSPDGRWLGFLADRGKRTQIHLVRSDGGEAHQLTEGSEPVTDFRWSPDGRRIAFTRIEPEGDLARRKDRYGDFAVEDRDFRQTHLWLVEVDPDGRVSEAARRLTQGPAFGVNAFSWSPDGGRIAVELRPDPLITSTARADISVITVSSGEIRPLVTTPGADTGPIWSPDGQSILFSTAAGDTTSNYYRNGHLAVIPASGGPARRVAADLDENPGAVAWTPTGIYVLAWQKTRRHLFRVDPSSGRTTTSLTNPAVITTADFTADGRTGALAGQGPTTLAEVYRFSMAGGAPVALTDLTGQLAGWRLGASEVVSWKSQDGATIEGVLHKPPDFDPTRRYPLLVIIHGGPTGIDFPAPVTGYVYPALQWLAKGALVLRPNYRGSAGYGEAFRSLNVRNLGVGDAWDVLSGVDHLIRLGLADSARTAAMGWSQGGYISAFLTTNSNRFKAISVGAGISDWMTYYVNTDIHPFTRQYLKATPWDDPAIYALTSPITNIKRASTPTLIQHGELDRRVPIPNAYELFQGLQDVGVDTRLLVYKGFGHGIDKPKELLAAMWHNWQWFGQYLWGENVELPLPADTTASASQE